MRNLEAHVPRDQFPAWFEAARSPFPTPEALEMWTFLKGRVGMAVRRASRVSGGLLMTITDQEESVGEVLEVLCAKGLDRFRGGSVPSLGCFAFRIGYLLTLQRIRRIQRERRGLSLLRAESLGEEMSSEGVDAPQGALPPPAFPRAAPLPSAGVPDADLLLFQQLWQERGHQGHLADRLGTSGATLSRRLTEARLRFRSLPAEQKGEIREWLLENAA